MAYPTGCIYQRPKSPFWWAKIVPYEGAQEIFESTKRTRKDHAETYLKEAEGLSDGPGPRPTGASDLQ
jgi:hypothetical protein